MTHVLALALVLADAAAEGKKVIVGMLIVGLLLAAPASDRRDVHVLPVPPARPLGALDA